MPYNYQIFHASGPDRFMAIEAQPRVLVGFVEANSLEEAYELSQNGEDSSWNRFNPCRSTSVGDAIKDEEGYHMVTIFGFKLL